MLVGKVIGERAKRVRHIPIVNSPIVNFKFARLARHNSSACHVYVMWAELGYSHFFVRAVIVVV